MHDDHHVANRLSTGLIKSDGTSNPPSPSVITYQYDANDRLTKSTLQGPPPFVAMAKTADDLYAESSSRRSHHGMKAFALAALGTLCVPVLLMRSRHRPLGRRARRRRIVNSAMLVFMALLMAVGPENVQAAYLNSALYQSLTAAGLAQTDTTETTYQYDAAGNLTEERRNTGTDDFNSYAYDAENHLRSATIRLDGDGQGFRFLSYTYDADGIRTSKTVKIGQGTETTTYYVVDKNRDYAQVLEERDANGTLAVRYVYGLDLIAQVRGTNPSYYHYDGLGSTRQLTNASASAPTDTYTYEAFGRRLESGTGDQVDNDYRFTGEQYDSQTSQYYLRARYYQPGTGRFTGRDAAEGYTSDPITLHKYLYGGADPVNRIDPSGQMYADVTVSSAIRSFLISAFRPTFLFASKKAIMTVFLGRLFIGGTVACFIDAAYISWYMPPLIDELRALSSSLASVSQYLSNIAMNYAVVAAKWYADQSLQNIVARIVVPQFGAGGSLSYTAYQAYTFFELVGDVEKYVAGSTQQYARLLGISSHLELDVNKTSLLARILTHSIDPAGDLRALRRTVELLKQGQFLSASAIVETELKERLQKYGHVRVVKTGG